jgi:transient receptor potential cation channel subfamily C protein 4
MAMESYIFLGFVWTEVKQLYSEGVHDYLSNWWNLLDFITNSLYVITVVLRLTAYLIVEREQKNNNEEAYYTREKWDPWDPTLISESLFAIANIFSTLKLIYIFTIHPNLGPLQISIGKMVFDIFK